jgi:hypothetical protein
LRVIQPTTLAAPRSSPPNESKGRRLLRSVVNHNDTLNTGLSILKLQFGLIEPMGARGLSPSGYLEP